MSSDVVQADRQRQKMNEFMQLLPLIFELAGLPHSEIGKKGMGHLHAAALALDLRSGVRAIDLNVLEHYARSDMKRALAPLLS